MKDRLNGKDLRVPLGLPPPIIGMPPGRSTNIEGSIGTSAIFTGGILACVRAS